MRKVRVGGRGREEVEEKGGREIGEGEKDGGKEREKESES